MNAYARIALIVANILLIFLFLFQSIWVSSGSATGIMSQVGLQRTRAQTIVKDVLILAYRPVDEQAQATGELQIVLPAWERTQMGLRNGDASLQLPQHVPESISQLILASQPDFLAIDAATKVVLNQGNPVDPLQITIIEDHQQSYSAEMALVQTAWQQQIDGAFQHIFWIETGLDAIVFVLVLFVLFFRRKVVQSTR